MDCVSVVCLCVGMSNFKFSVDRLFLGNRSLLLLLSNIFKTNPRTGYQRRQFEVFRLY
jgi:hypothetical protein